MQDLPSAQGLIEAVAQFIEREVTPTITDHRLKFRSLIAANVLAIVNRELATGDSLLRTEWQRLAVLTNEPDAAPANSNALREGLQRRSQDLCKRIRAGEADDGPWAEAVFAHAQATVIEKLQIANPRFLERVGR
jgi:hypothetical protein